MINYRKQELERYKNPTKPFKFILEDRRQCVVGPAAKKLLSTQHAKPR